MQTQLPLGAPCKVAMVCGFSGSLLPNLGGIVVLFHPVQAHAATKMSKLRRQRWRCTCGFGW